MNNREAIRTLNEMFMDAEGVLTYEEKSKFVSAISTLAHSVGILEVVNPEGLELCDECKTQTLRRFFMVTKNKIKVETDVIFFTNKDGTQYCSYTCNHSDGKRCNLFGTRLKSNTKNLRYQSLRHPLCELTCRS